VREDIQPRTRAAGACHRRRTYFSREPESGRTRMYILCGSPPLPSCRFGHRAATLPLTDASQGADRSIYFSYARESLSCV